ncbi:zinc finger protein ubi-d4 B-like isoform X2 [Bacillus rossius redtenbacheri]|uniref:zinc finger protein ubi-d4 B-like isoform X2 n=1 Tax=Bacillus rossius redtenbacheri TaxID=93214 RepID=UPI002FDE5F01
MTCDIQVVNPSVLSKIESFFNDSAYREAIENSANYNTRLCIERRLRMPFLDSQTGVAQNHSNLFMSPRQRIPGVSEGQIYTYPSRQWRKRRRQYLTNFLLPRRKEAEPEGELHTISTVENPAATNEDSKDSMGLKDETAKDAWYYDELDIQEMEGFDDPDPDSDIDYEESFSKRKGKKRTTKVVRTSDSPSSKKPKGPGRGRKKNSDGLSDAEKPFVCELCGARYKTRPGLTYHYRHSHKDHDDDESPGSEGTSVATDGGSVSPSARQQPAPPSAQPATTATTLDAAAAAAVFTRCYVAVDRVGWLTCGVGATGGSGGGTRRGRQGSVSTPHAPPSTSSASSSPAVSLQPAEESSSGEGASSCDRRPPELLLPISDDKERAAPSPYCDFCLGDASENKKTGQPEELVSCSDCGRSGHPTCLQFTANMIVSVRKYRWQCIECKCCSICGMSDNDDQLLFCDDCDRGYHMYCLAPPLASPPEGSWSCRLCLVQFHGQ